MKNRTVGIGLSYINTILNTACGLFLSSYLLRMLGDTEYGIYQTVSSFVGYLVLLEFGTGTAITRNIARCRAKGADEEEIRNNISTIWTINWIMTVVILAVAAVFYIELGNIYSKTLDAGQIEYAREIFLFAAAYLLVSFFAHMLQGILLGFEKYRIQPFITLIRIILRTMLLVVAVLFYRYSIVIAVIDATISALILIYLFWYCISVLKLRFSFSGFKSAIFKESFPLCIAIFIQTIVNQANSNVDKFVIGIRMGPEKVAVYSIGLFIYNMFSSLTTIPISMYAPQVINDVSKGMEEDELTERLIPPSRIIVLIGCTVLFGFFVSGRQFISIFYGDDYLIAWAIALIIMVPMMINMSNGILINVLDAKNKRMSRSIALLITTTANIVLTVWWINIWGIIGACLATAVCTFAGQIIIMDIYYSRVLHIRVMYMYYKSFKGILLFQIISAGAGFFVGRVIPNTVLSFIASGTTFLVLFFALYCKFGATDDEKEKMKSLLGRIKKAS